jgi:pimeloyl-ACP methyl ester carboxylesterase
MIGCTGRWLFASVLLLAPLGCAARHTNSSFPMTVAEARQDWERMCESPRPPERPVVVIGGYADLGIAPASMEARLRHILGPKAVIIPVDVGFEMTMTGARERLIRRVAEALPETKSDDPPEVDVVAVSMGGLVARFAAVPLKGGGRLRIARLFTICSPHQGARLAEVPTLEGRVIDMRHGSGFLTELNGQERDYELVCYARLGDSIVGEENCAPPGMSPWWVEAPPLEAPHLAAPMDLRILADIGRRLRGEEPIAHGTAQPLPAGS